jgi:hypothetical protein
VGILDTLAAEGKVLRDDAINFIEQTATNAEAGAVQALPTLEDKTEAFLLDMVPAPERPIVQSIIDGAKGPDIAKLNAALTADGKSALGWIYLRLDALR